MLYYCFFFHTLDLGVGFDFESRKLMRLGCSVADFKQQGYGIQQCNKFLWSIIFSKTSRVFYLCPGNVV